jgi:3'(2'), 5'-bisphosphate nucleotidase
MKEPNSKNLLFTAIKASLDAADPIIRIYNTDFGVEMKKDNSPLTLADKTSHEVIMNYLIDTGIPVLSEEGKDIPFAQRKNWKMMWIVDPLDGTKEFIKKNGEFTINIALVREGIPVIGVIYAPVLNTLYFAEKSLGSWKKENITSRENPNNLEALVAVSLQLPIKDMDHRMTVVASRSHLNPETEAFINNIKTNHSDINIVSRGSSLKLCLIAEGTADIYPRYAPTMEWDIAAGHAIISYSGGSIIEVNSEKELVYNRENLLNPWFIARREM